MPSTFPCPNPACQQVLTADMVKGARQLVCPLCRTVFQFRPDRVPADRPESPTKAEPPPVPSPQTAPFPAAKPASARKAPPSHSAGPTLPVPRRSAASRLPAAPLPPPPPVGTSVPQEELLPSLALEFGATPNMVVPRSRRQPAHSRGAARAIGLSVLVVAGVGLLAGGAYLIRKTIKDNPESGIGSKAATLGNSQFDLPGEPWKRDENIERKLVVNVALRRSNPSNVVALFYKDYKTRLPSDAELIDTALTKLRGYFKPLEYERKPSDQAPTLAGRPTLALEFQGDDPERVTMNGVCVLLADRGYGYWFFTWAPAADDQDQAAQEWQELRQRFHLLEGREGWTPQPRQTEPMQATEDSPVRYRLDYVKGLWKEVEARDYDPLADRVLLGEDPTQAPLAGKAATFQVLILPRAPNLKQAAQAARAHLLQRQKEDYPRTTMTPIKDRNGREQDRDARIGQEKGHLSKLRVSNADGRERYVVLGVVHCPRGVVALVGDCDWNRRDFWEHEFTPLLATFRILQRR